MIIYTGAAGDAYVAGITKIYVETFHGTSRKQRIRIPAPPGKCLGVGKQKNVRPAYEIAGRGGRIALGR